MSLVCLGLEGTAHTFGAALVTSEGEVLSNIRKAYSPKEGGMHPREAAEHHSQHASVTIRQAMEKAGVSYPELGLVSFSRGPGLGPCLRVTATAARALSQFLQIPLMGVNHCIAHIEIGKLRTEAKDPVLLYASGANTQVIAYARKRFRIFGETLDIGIGNMLDKFGREQGMSFPSGPLIETLARKGSFVELPYSIKGMDVAFSGLYTAATQLVRKGAALEDVCFSLQEHAFAMLVEVTERAMAHTGKNEVLLGGGVSANMRLREMTATMAEERGGRFYVPEREFCVDNAAMIAWLGLLMTEAGERMSIEESGVDQNFRTDYVDVTWIED